MGEWGVDRMETDLDEIHQMDGISRPRILLYAYANSVATPIETVSDETIPIQDADVCRCSHLSP
jgi:hypothetical protein